MCLYIFTPCMKPGVISWLGQHNDSLMTHIYITQWWPQSEYDFLLLSSVPRSYINQTEVWNQSWGKKPSQLLAEKIFVLLSIPALLPHSLSEGSGAAFSDCISAATYTIVCSNCKTEQTCLQFIFQNFPRWQDQLKGNDRLIFGLPEFEQKWVTDHPKGSDPYTVST